MKVPWTVFELQSRHDHTAKCTIFNFKGPLTPKIHNPELRFLRSASRLMLLYISVKFHENISNGFWVTEQTRFCDRQMTDRRPGQKQYVSQPYRGRRNCWFWLFAMATEMSNFRKKYSKIFFSEVIRGGEAETLRKCLCYYALHKFCFLLLLCMWFRCYGNFKFP